MLSREQILLRILNGKNIRILIHLIHHVVKLIQLARLTNQDHIIVSKHQILDIVSGRCLVLSEILLC